MESPENNDLRSKWKSHIDALLKQRAEIDRRIMGYQTMIRGLDYVGADEESDWTVVPEPLPPGMENLHSAGLTDAIRLVLSNATRLLMPREIRDRLLQYEYKRLPESNPMAAVHGVIRRLVEAGEVESGKIDSSRTGYRILSAVERAVKTGLR